MPMAFATLSVRTRTEHVGVNVDPTPDTCPYCHYAIVPEFIHGYLDHNILYTSWVCVRNSCNSYFITRHSPDFRGTFLAGTPINGYPNEINFSEIIAEISTDFIKIYSQALQAQIAGLDQVCGMGFRKSLEFLIKDYIIYRNSQLREAVEKKMLGSCINDHIESAKIREISKRAAWLGNDESHFVRVWKGHDIDALKSLINLTVHWIETEDLTDKMIAQMDPSNPSA